jgi:phosphatidylglycerol:prolipoprotein diacylglycerol transferase
MIPYLFHIGPLYFNMYGFCIAMGILAFLWLAQKDPLAKKYLKKDQLVTITIFCVVIGLIGSRIVNVIQYPADYPTLYDIIAIWEGGLSLAGVILALLITLPLYLAYNHIKIMPLLDLVGIYGALLQAIARLGCFFAGCCHGYPTHVFWAITYTHPDSYAPRNIPIHPSQLYSSFMLFIIFIIMHFIAQPRLKKPGQLFGLYLTLTSAERFFNDFFRAEHYQESLMLFQLTQNQALALILCCFGLAYFIVASTLSQDTYLNHESI